MAEGLEGFSIGITEKEAQLFNPKAGFEGIAIEQDLFPKQIFERATGFKGVVIEITLDGFAHKTVKNSL